MAERYRRELERHGPTSSALHIPKARQQDVSFRVLTEIETPFSGSVLDVGCGFADFLGHLERERLQVRYTGIDIVPEFLDEARRRHPGADLRLGDLLLDPPEGPFDWVMLSGTLNFRLERGDTKTYVERMLTRMFELARRGIAANFLSTRVDWQRPEAHHSDPAEILRHLSGLGPRFAIRHDYMPYQFTAYAWRDARIGPDSIFAATLEAEARR
jgi:SAM-dependent methyltransferase